MTTVTITDVQARLPEIIAGLAPGEQLIIVQNDEPVAVLSRSTTGNWPCQAGSAKDRPHWMSPDFDAPLGDFAEYME